MEENIIEEDKDKIKKKKRGRPRNLVKEPLNEDTLCKLFLRRHDL